MKKLDEIIEILKTNSNELKKLYGIKEIKIFGSYAEGKNKKTSDLDIIVDFEEVPTFIQLIQIEKKLSKLLGVKVHLLTEESISPNIREFIKEIKVA